MARLNTRTATPPVRARGPIKTAPTATARTAEGARGYLRDEKSELFLLGVSYFAGENAFYEKADNRDQRFAALVRAVAGQDPQWIVDFTTWLRGDANIRTGSVVAAAVGADALLKAGKPEYVRALINGALQRADEPGEFVAYWATLPGRRTGGGRPDLPRPVKAALSQAVARLYNEYTAIKYDTASKGFRFGDVIRLAHAHPVDAVVYKVGRSEVGSAQKQAELYRWLVSRTLRHEKYVPEADGLLPMYARNKELLAELRTNRDRTLANIIASPVLLDGAGLNWEDLSGTGPMNKAAWTAIIPQMGYAALLRNLRNFEEAGIDRATKDYVAKVLAAPERVVKSRQLPLRFLSAYRNLSSDFFRQPLDDALNASLANVPALSGNTLILVDRSGSMFNTTSNRGTASWADTAALFGTAVALRAENATLVQFGSGSRQVSVAKGTNLLKAISSSFTNMGGTETAEAVRRHYAGHDRVVILTDEQTWYRYDEPAKQVPADIPVHTFNLAGYRVAQDATGPNRHQWGGLNDACFRLIQMVEAGATASWPWKDRACPGVPHQGHASSDWTCPLER